MKGSENKANYTRKGGFEVMKVVNETPSGVTPRAGCVCSEGWKSTRGLWQPIYNCNCNCTGHGDTTFNANFKKAKNA